MHLQPSASDDPAAFTCHPDLAAPPGSVLARCARHGVGHTAHWIQLGLAGRSPWFWRSAVVTHVHHDADGAMFTAVWVEDEDPLAHAMNGPSSGATGAEVTCWHHAREPELCVGYPLRLHPEYAVAETARGRFSVLICGR